MSSSHTRNLVDHTAHSIGSFSNSEENYTSFHPKEFKGTERRKSISPHVGHVLENTVAGDILNSLRRSESRSSSFESNRLSRQHTGGYSVKDIYGDMDLESVDRIRKSTTNNILDTLSKRAQDVQEHSESIKSHPSHLRHDLRGDEEHQIAREVESDATRDDKAGDDKNSSSLDNGSVYLKSAEKKGPNCPYDAIPDSSVPVKDNGEEFADIDHELVTWDGPDDPENPRNWPKKDKTLMTILVGLYTLISPMTSTICSPAMPEIGAQFGMGTFLKSFSVSVMVLAWAIGPLVIAPLSESDRIGRRPVLNVSIWVNLFFNIGASFSQNTVQFCICRFLGGLGGCAPLNVGAGSIADLFDADSRLLAMAFFSISPSIGPVISPVILSWVVENVNWRWCFHVLSIFNFCIAAVGTFYFKETYAPALLRKKCMRLQKETGNTHLHTIYAIADGETLMGKIWITISRPLMLLCTHPMVFGLGLYFAFCYGFMYLMLVTFPVVFQKNYGFSRGISGLMYIPMGLGFLSGLAVLVPVIGKVYKDLIKKNGGVAKPEYRLPLLLVSSFGLPIGLFWYGWSVQKQIHWIMPAIGTFIFGFAIVAVFQTIQVYLIDMNPRFAASSVAAAAVFRLCFGFGFPLFATAMYDRLDYGWGNTMCGFLALVLGVPFPLICMKYGESMRAWANARTDARQAKRDQKNLERLKKNNE